MKLPALAFHNFRFAPDRDCTLAGVVGVLYIFTAISHASGRKIRAFNKLEQVFGGGLGIIYKMHSGGGHFPQVMRRNIGSHTNRDTKSAVQKQVGGRRRQDYRFFSGGIIVSAKIYRIFIQIAKHFSGKTGHFGFRITHGGRAVAVYRTEVALSDYQRVAGGKILRQLDHRFINSRISVRVILTHNIADHRRRLSHLGRSV